MIARAGGMRRTDPPGQFGTGEQPPGLERLQSSSGNEVGPGRRKTDEKVTVSIYNLFLLVHMM